MSLAPSSRKALTVFPRGALPVTEQAKRVVLTVEDGRRTYEK